MCGIIGGLGFDVGPQILQSLQRLEYRGYDSFGLSLDSPSFEGVLIRRIGAPSDYDYESFQLKQPYKIGIGHTRWATHGGVCEENAHPHKHLSRLGSLSVVHNGIVENLDQMRQLLELSYKQRLLSQTDTEVILLYVVQLIDKGADLPQALRQLLSMMHGSFSIVIMEHQKQRLWAVKQDLPLYYITQNEQYWLISDLQALKFPPQQAHLVADRAIFELSPIKQGYADNDEELSFISVQAERQDHDSDDYTSTNFFFTEVQQQPQIIAQLLKRSIEPLADDIQEYHIIGCGSSYHAGMIAALILESVIQKPIRVFIASEFRSCPPVVGPKTGLIALSQSGETADLLAALREQAAQYASLIGICNRIDATLSRLVDHCYYLQIGYERSVAATKSFTAQVALLCLILLPDQERLLLQQEALLWEQQASRLLEEQHIERWAKILSSYQALMILGRGPFCGLAQEAALKIKELTYTHVHSLPLAELKHGSLAVIDAQCPILLFLARDSFVQKNLVAVHEILARSGRLFIIAQEGVPLSELQGKAEILVVPAIKNLMLQILLFSLPVQLLAGLWAQNRGLNIDKPRHLAKSVTVE